MEAVAVTAVIKLYLGGFSLMRSCPLLFRACFILQGFGSLLMAFSTIQALSREAFPIVRTTSVHGLLGIGENERERRMS